MFLTAPSWVYIAAALGAWVASTAIGRWRRPERGDVDAALDDLDAYGQAYLAGGPVRAADAALVSLAQRDRLVIGDHVLTIGRAGPALELAADNVFRGRAAEMEDHPLDRAILDQLREAGASGRQRLPLLRAVVESTGPIADQLVDRDLLMSDRSHRRLVLLSKLPMIAVWLAGFAWLVYEVASAGSFGMPTLLLGASGAIFWHRRSPSRRTRLGDRALSALRVQHRGLAASARSEPEALTGAQMASAYALFEPSKLSGPARQISALAARRELDAEAMRDATQLRPEDLRRWHIDTTPHD